MSKFTQLRAENERLRAALNKAIIDPWREIPKDYVLPKEAIKDGSVLVRRVKGEGLNISIAYHTVSKTWRADNGAYPISDFQEWCRIPSARYALSSTKEQGTNMKSGPKPRRLPQGHHLILHQLVDEIESRQLSAANVCEEAGLTKSYLSMARRGQVLNPSIAAISSIAQILGYDLTLTKREQR